MNRLQRLKMAMLANMEEKGLPSEYRAVAYLQSTGTQYIDTGIIPNNTTGIKAKVELNIQSGAYNYLGARITESSRFALTFHYGNAGFGWDVYYPLNVIFPLNVETTQELNYNNSRIVRFNNETLFTNLPLLMLPSNFPNLYLFGQNTNTTPLLWGYKIYEVEITQDENIIRHYIPCYRKADNVAGMYDLVNDVFYTNAGTGKFIVGGEI